MKFLKISLVVLAVCLASIITYANIRYVSKSEICDVHWVTYQTSPDIDSTTFNMVELEIKKNPNVMSTAKSINVTDATMTIMYCYHKQNPSDFKTTFDNFSISSKQLTIKDITGKEASTGPSKCPVMNANNSLVAFINVFDFRN